MLADINTTRNKEKYPNFTSRIPKGIFSSPKEIPHLRCAICDRRMLSKGEVTSMSYGYRPLSPAELITQVKKETDNRLPHGVRFVRELLNSRGLNGLKKFYFENMDKTIDVSSEKIDRQIHKVLTQMMKIISKSPKKEERLPIPRIMKNINKRKSDLPKETEEFVDILSNYTATFPNLTIKQIIDNPTLYNYHSMFLNQQQSIHNEKNRQVRDNLRKISEKMPAGMKESLADLTDTAISISHNKSLSDELRRYKIASVYSEFLGGMKEGFVKRRIEKQINSIDLAHASGDYIFCRLHNTKDIDDQKIIDFIINPLKNTFEHVQLDSEGGTKDIENGIYLCTHCNQERGNMPYPDIIRVYPESPRNIQKQVSRLTTFIKKGALVGYETYPQGIKKTLKDFAGIDINIDRFLRDQKSILEKRLADNKETLVKVKALKIATELKRDNYVRQMEESGLKTNIFWKFAKTQSIISKYEKQIVEIQSHIYSDKTLLESMKQDLSKKN